MTSKTLKAVLERVQAWPEGRQDDAAKVLIEMERQDVGSIGLTDPQVREVERRLAKLHRHFISLDEARKRLMIRRA